MNGLKPGFKTTEFWLAMVGKVISGLALIGILNTSDAGMLSDALTKIIGAVAVVLLNAGVILAYLKGRLALKQKLPLILLALLLFGAGPARAQSILPWRNGIHQRLLALEQRQNQPAPAPVPTPQPIIIQPPATPPAVGPQLIMVPQQPQQSMPPIAWQQLPLAPQGPIQQLPLAPQGPIQSLPLAPQGPIQQLPLAPQGPIQQLPLAPSAPIQQLPLAPPGPPQPLPLAPPANKLPSSPPAPPAAPPFTPANPTPAPTGGWPQSAPPDTSPQRLSAWTNCLWRP
jgi:hypothetical protein